ncbi:hypothetical protein Tco_0322631 [Tanacetum coccineum]
MPALDTSNDLDLPNNISRRRELNNGGDKRKKGFGNDVYTGEARELYGSVKNRKKTVKNGQARTRESEEYKKKPKDQSRSQKCQASVKDSQSWSIKVIKAIALSFYNNHKGCIGKREGFSKLMGKEFNSRALKYNSRVIKVKSGESLARSQEETRQPCLAIRVIPRNDLTAIIRDPMIEEMDGDD